MDRSNDARGLERRKGCDFCDEHKYKCDKKKPKCSKCELHGILCQWKSKTSNCQETPIKRALSTTRLVKVEPGEEAATSNQTDPFPLPPCEDVQEYIDNYFGIFNTCMPLFDDQEYQNFSRKSHTWVPGGDYNKWASLNVIIALAIRNTPEDMKAYCKETESNCIANAQSAISKFAHQPPTVLNLQTTLGLALVLMTGPYPQSASSIMRLAVKMIYELKLHLPSNKPFDNQERQHNERLFWIAYIIDRDLSLLISEPHLLQDNEIGLNIKDMVCRVGLGNIMNDGVDILEILQARAELAVIQGKLYDLVRSLKASKFSLAQKQSAESRLYQMLRACRMYLSEPRINIWDTPAELDSRSNWLHEALLHLTYYRCLYSVANVSVGNRDWMQKLNDFSDRYNAGGDMGVLTSASQLLPSNWRYLVESAHTCQEEVLDGIHIPADRALKWISLPVFEATITVLAVQIITFPVRNLERTSPDAVNPIERYETDEDELWLEEALRTYNKFVDGIKDPQVLECYSLCEDLASKAENTLETFFNDPTSDVPDTENNGLVEEADPELYMDS